MWIWYVFSNPLYLGIVGAYHQAIERRVESLPGLGNCFFSLCISRQSVIWLEALILKPHCLGQDLGFISYGLITLSLCFLTYKKKCLCRRFVQKMAWDDRCKLLSWVSGIWKRHHPRRTGVVSTRRWCWVSVSLHHPDCSAPSPCP